MIAPVNLTSPKNIRAFLKKLETLKLLTFKTDMKTKIVNGKEEKKAIIFPDINERQLAAHLVLASNGETYLLEDILSNSEHLLPIDFRSRETGKRISAHQIINDLSLTSHLIQNLELARLLCHVDMNPNNLFYKGQWPTCPITKSKIIFPASTLFGDIFECHGIVTAAIMLKRNPINNAPLEKKDIIPNKAIQDFIWTNFTYRQSINKRYPTQTLEEEKADVLSILSAQKKYYTTPLASTASTIFFDQHPRLQDRENLKLRKAHLLTRSNTLFPYLFLISTGMLLPSLLGMLINVALIITSDKNTAKETLHNYEINGAANGYTAQIMLFIAVIFLLPMRRKLDCTETGMTLLTNAESILDEIESKSEEIKENSERVEMINKLESELKNSAKLQSKQRLFQPTRPPISEPEKDNELTIKKVV